MRKLAIVLFLTATAAYADYLDLKRPASLKAEPRGDSKSIVSLQPPVNLRLMQSDQQNGYYHVQEAKTGRQGWVYRTLGRRVKGDIPQEKTGTKGAAYGPGDFPVSQCRAPFNEEAVAGLPIESCGLQGDADPDSSEAPQNLRKNDLCRTGAAQPITMSELEELQTEVDDSGLVYGSRFRGKGPPMERSPLESLPTLKDGTKLAEGDLVTFVGYLSEAHYMPKSASQGDKKGGESVNCHKTQHEMADIHLALNSVPGRIKPKDPQHQQKFCKTISAEFIPHERPAVWNVDNLNLVIDAERPVRVTGQLFFDGSHEPCRDGAAATGDPQRLTVWEIHPVYTFEVCKFDDVKKCSASGKASWQPLSSANGIDVGDDEQDQ